MDVRVMQQILPPSVQNTQEADICSQVFRIGSDFEKCLGAGAKQKAIDRLLVL